MSRPGRLIACLLMGTALLSTARGASGDVPTSDDHQLQTIEALTASRLVVTPELLDRVLEVVEDLYPERAQRMRVVRENEPRRFLDVVRTNRTLISLARLKANDPHIYGIKRDELRAELNARRVAEQLHEAIGNDSAEVEKLRSRLQREVMNHIAHSMRVRVQYLARLRSHIDTLREQIDDQAGSFVLTVNERVDALIGSSGRLRDPILQARLSDLQGHESAPAYFDHEIDCRDPHTVQIEALAADRVSKPIPPEFLDQVLEVIRDVDPARAKRMRIARERHPDRFERVIRSNRALVGLTELKLHAPDLYEIKCRELQAEVTVHRHVERLREAAAKGHDVSRRRAELTRLVQTQVARSLRARVLYLSRLESHIDPLRQQVDAEARGFMDNVEQRMRDLTDDPVLTAIDE